MGRNGRRKEADPEQVGPDAQAARHRAGHDRTGKPRQRGYKLWQFEEAFSRYLPSEGISNRSTVQNAANTGNGGERGLTINRTVSMLMYGLPGPLVFWFESLVDAPRPGLRPSEQGVRNPQRFAASRLSIPNHSFHLRECALLLRGRASARAH